MGNFVSSQCLNQIIGSRSSTIKLIFFGGATRALTGTHVAGEIMFEFPDKMVCQSDSFFIGRPIPSLGIHDELVGGQTYFVIPIDRLPAAAVNFTAATLAGLKSSPSPAPINLGECTFDYVRARDGGVLIKVAPEFIVRLITEGSGDSENGCRNSDSGYLCTTPELKKHYKQLVGSKEQVWSPKLETISEYKIRYSPCRVIGFKTVER